MQGKGGSKCTEIGKCTVGSGKDGRPSAAMMGDEWGCIRQRRANSVLGLGSVFYRHQTSSSQNVITWEFVRNENS